MRLVESLGMKLDTVLIIQFVGCLAWGCFVGCRDDQSSRGVDWLYTGGWGLWHVGGIVGFDLPDVCLEDCGRDWGRSRLVSWLDC